MCSIVLFILSATIATAASAVLYVITHVPYVALLPLSVGGEYEDPEALLNEGNARYLLCFIPNSAIAVGFDSLHYAERFGWNTSESKYRFQLFKHQLFIAAELS